jgi:hypothetical protein
MSKEWSLTPSEEKRTIDVDGGLSETPCHICMEEEGAIAESERRIKLYLQRGGKIPPGYRFFLKRLAPLNCLTNSSKTVICIF